MQSKIFIDQQDSNLSNYEVITIPPATTQSFIYPKVLYHTMNQVNPAKEFPN